MFAVTSEANHVIIDLRGRRRDVLMGCGEAERFAAALESAAVVAELAPPQLIRGEPWECQVVSFDGLVAVRFYPPTVGAPQRVPLPPAIARALAGRVRFAIQQAAYRMRFEFSDYGD